MISMRAGPPEHSSLHDILPRELGSELVLLENQCFVATFSWLKEQTPYCVANKGCKPSLPSSYLNVDLSPNERICDLKFHFVFAYNILFPQGLWGHELESMSHLGNSLSSQHSSPWEDVPSSTHQK